MNMVTLISALVFSSSIYSYSKFSNPSFGFQFTFFISIIVLILNFKEFSHTPIFFYRSQISFI